MIYRFCEHPTGLGLHLLGRDFWPLYSLNFFVNFFVIHVLIGAAVLDVANLVEIFGCELDCLDAHFCDKSLISLASEITNRFFVVVMVILYLFG